MLYRAYPNIGYARAVTMICRRPGFRRLGSLAALALAACASAPIGSSLSAAPSGLEPSPTPTASATLVPPASTSPSIRALTAPADSTDLLGEMRNRPTMGVTLAQFITRWNEVAGDSMQLNEASISIDANGSFLHDLGGNLAVLGYVTKAGELTSAAVLDGTNLLSDRMERALSALNGSLARLSLITATEPGLSFADRAKLIQEIEGAIRLTAGDEFLYDTSTTHAALTDGVVYYLVGATDDTLMLIAAGIQ